VSIRFVSSLHGATPRTPADNWLKHSAAFAYGLSSPMALQVQNGAPAVHRDPSVSDPRNTRRRPVLAAAGSVAPSRDTDSKAHTYMKRAPRQQTEQEPVGIVISRGSRHEDLPTVWAYVWGPAPDDGDVPAEAS